MSKRPKKTPFTLEGLKELHQSKDRLDIATLREHLPDWSREDIVYRLGKWRYKGNIRFKLVDDDLVEFEIVRIGRRSHQPQTSPEETAQLTQLRTWLAVENLYELRQLIKSGTLKDKEKLEAIKELGRIERGLTSPKATDYAKQIESQLGVINLWQDITD